MGVKQCKSVIENDRMLLEVIENLVKGVQLENDTKNVILETYLELHRALLLFGQHLYMSSHLHLSWYHQLHPVLTIMRLYPLGQWMQQDGVVWFLFPKDRPHWVKWHDGIREGEQYQLEDIEGKRMYTSGVHL